jgi:hypothetical protein
MKRFLALALITFTAACGGGGGGDDTGDDTVTPDAEVGDDPDSEVPRVCDVEAALGTVTLTNPVADSMGAAATPDFERGGGLINGDAMPDVFQLELYKGFGVFADTEIVPGTYTLAGEELNYSTCGVCPRIFANVDTTNGMPTQQFFVTGGSVNITAINPNLTFTVTDLTFVEVTIDETTFVSTPVPDGCPSAITSLSFDAVVTNTP